MDELSSRYQGLSERITQSVLQAGRQPHSVQLLAVSKTFPADQVAAVGLATRLQHRLCDALT